MSAEYTEDELLQAMFEHIDEWDNDDQISTYKFLIRDILDMGDKRINEFIRKTAREELTK